ncbi:hypothetical protein SDC9_122363 [bioreactor metagenome]|uniref:Uncharacterized protein n=1 Tax=bioreactor metagenome TaxID=1076179 RepID=A0A645CEK2_9ZZZZ
MLLPRRPRISRRRRRLPESLPTTQRPPGRCRPRRSRPARRTRRTISPPGAGHLLPGSPPGRPQPGNRGGPAVRRRGKVPHRRFPRVGRINRHAGATAPESGRVSPCCWWSWGCSPGRSPGSVPAICGPVTCPARRFRAVRPRRSPPTRPRSPPR